MLDNGERTNVQGTPGPSGVSFGDVCGGINYLKKKKKNYARHRVRKFSDRQTFAAK